MDRIEFLRSEALAGRGHEKRQPFKDPETVRTMGGTLYFRRAQALAWLFDNSPVHIAEKELIVGTRTLLREINYNKDGSSSVDYSVSGAIPSYINSDDVEIFNTNEENYTKTHYTPDYGIALEKGIGGIISSCEEKLKEVEKALSSIEREYPEAKAIPSCFEKQIHTKLPHDVLCKVRAKRNSVEFLNCVIITWKACSRFILRYAQLARDMADGESDCVRRRELLKIEEVCRHISTGKPRDFRDAVQLYRFCYLMTIMECQEFINYGRLDTLLDPFLGDISDSEAEELLACLLIKFYDQQNLHFTYLGVYGGQITMTLGGVDKNGDNAVCRTTMLIMNALSRTRLSEPLVSFRINKKNPPEYLTKLCELSQSGLNTIGMYNDDLFIDSLVGRGVPAEYANCYGFGLCQDIQVPGCDNNSNGIIFDPIREFIPYINEHTDAKTFEEFYEGFKKLCDEKIKEYLGKIKRTEEAFVKFRDGDFEQYFDSLKKGEINSHLNFRSLMTPLPTISALYRGCIENGADITLGSCILKTQGFYLFSPVVTSNSLVAVKYAVFDKKKYTLRQICDALETDFEGAEGEKLRLYLLNAPKWGNDDCYADSIAVDFLEGCLRTAQNHTTAEGGKMLTGIHNPHSYSVGRTIPATPDGRHSGDAISVTMTPSSGTAKNGPLATLKSGAKFDHLLINWNYCLMLNLSMSLFKVNDKLMETLLTAYFDMGGMQLQPNICSVEELKDAQLHPDKYENLIVRLWGVSVRFIDITKELQDEVIERFS